MVTMVRHNFCKNGFQGNQSYVTCQLYQCCTVYIPRVVKIGLTLTKVHSEIALFSNIVSKTVILPQCLHRNTLTARVYIETTQGSTIGSEGKMKDTIDLCLEWHFGLCKKAQWVLRHKCHMMQSLMAYSYVWV